jgi:hypothetical protein
MILSDTQRSDDYRPRTLTRRMSYGGQLYQIFLYL